MYGCYKPNTEVDSTKINDTIKLLPYMLNDKNKIFSYKDCTFGLEKEKENTARIVVFKELNVMNCYTLESTFYGSDALGKLVTEDEDDAESDHDEEVKLSKPSNDQTDQQTPIQDETDNNDDHQSQNEVSLSKEESKGELNDSPSNIQDSPVEVKEELELKRKTSKTKNKKPRVVGDIHVAPKHLHSVGADLCRSMYSLFNENIKLRKLNHLRKLRIKFNRAKTTIK